MKHNANHYGEKYRKLGFSKDEYGNNFGCYTTFNINKSFKKLKPSSKKFQRVANIITFENDSGFVLNTTENEANYDFSHYKEIERYDSIFYNKELDLVMGFFWDGDGTLVFIDKKDRIFINTDCKKDYNWEVIKG